MPARSLLATLLLLALPGRAEEALPLVFEDDFSRGADRWEPTDPTAWTCPAPVGSGIFAGMG